MPRQKRPKPLYQRGSYQLHRREGRTNLEIVWYDAERKRERSRSAGTGSVREGQLAVDRIFLASSEGRGFCPTCGRPHDADAGTPIVAAVIADQVLKCEGKVSFKAISHRLAHVAEYLKATDPETRTHQVDEKWIERFRQHEARRPIVSSGGKERERTAGTIENSVVALAAAFRAHGVVPQFTPRRPKDVSPSPLYRADIKLLAAMFRYCVAPQPPKGEQWSDRMTDWHRGKRKNLLGFLRISVATWCRPDAAHDFTTDPKMRQWIPAGPAIALNPFGRKQTRKVRPTVPAPRQIVDLLNATDGQLVTGESVKSAWLRMATELGMPMGGGEAGMKLIRRSIAHIARKRIGEAQWVQGETMLGHRASSTSDIYALPDPAHLGIALAATESIIDDIESLVPGAFTADLPHSRPALQVVNGGKNG